MNTKTIVPFADLHAQYLSIKEEIDNAIACVIRDSAFIRGPYVEKFEEQFATLTGQKHCVSCANGTDALYLAMRALGLSPNDEVIAPAHTWISTTETITQAGGIVRFCDTDAQTYTIDPGRIEALITPRTVGIIPVHLCGQPADMARIMDIAKKHGLWVIEDCAQAHLASYQGQMVGSFGHAATYSFYPGKNLGAMGDAGALTTNDAKVAVHAAMLARHGGLKKGDHQIEGLNSRMDGLQAAILSVKLPHLPEWTRRRQQLALDYATQLADIDGIELPHTAPGRGHVYHLFMIRHEQRDALAKHLSASGIQTVVNYPTALPFVPAYARYSHRPEEFPSAHYNQSRILSLPLFPEMTQQQLGSVATALRSFAG